MTSSMLDQPQRGGGAAGSTAKPRDQECKKKNESTRRNENQDDESSGESLGLDNFGVHPLDFGFEQVRAHRKIYEQSTQDPDVEANYRRWQQAFEQAQNAGSKAGGQPQRTHQVPDKNREP